MALLVSSEIIDPASPHPHHPSTTRGNRTFLPLARATEEMEQYTWEITRGGHHSNGFLLVLAMFKWRGWNVKIPFSSPRCKEWSFSHLLTEFVPCLKNGTFTGAEIPFICQLKTTEGISFFFKCTPSKLTYSDCLHSKDSDFRSTYLTMQGTILIWKYLFWKTKDLICFILSAKQPDVMNLFKLQTVKT